MKFTAALANCTWLAASLPAWIHFRQALADPARAQHRQLRRIVQAHAGSAYGRQYRIAEIESCAEFQERVPLVDYDHLEPWVARILRGEQNVLTSTPVTRLLPTSGSSGARKLIPCTADYHRELNAAIGPWMVDLFLSAPSALLGPAYWSISPAIPSAAHENSAIPIGFEDDSAYLGGLKQRVVEAALAVPGALRQVQDTECSRYLTLLSLLRQPDLRLVSVWHPSFFTLMLEALPRWWGELLHDLEHGGCCHATALPGDLGRAFHARPQPRRAQALRKVDPLDTRSIWPSLQLVSCWADGQAGHAAADLLHRLPFAKMQGKGLLATEAVVSIPFASQHPLAITSHFFEFLDSQARVRQAHELTLGETYEVIVTTSSGLWRYRLGDLVEVDGFVSATPSLCFLGRGASTSDLCGEKLREAFVTKAMAAACAASSLGLAFAMIAPETPNTRVPHYTLFIEGELPPMLLSQLEIELRRNPHYALCRELGQLGELALFQITQCAYEKFCAVLQREGQRLGDIKPRALSPRTDWRTHFTVAS